MNKDEYNLQLELGLKRRISFLREKVKNTQDLSCWLYWIMQWHFTCKAFSILTYETKHPLDWTY